MKRIMLLLAALATGLAMGSGAALSAPASSPDAQAEREINKPRVIGGTPVPNGKYRYVAALLDKRMAGGPFQQQFCGGTLIDRDSVLTAAHCFDNNSRPSNFRVLLGRAQLNDGRRGVFRNVERIIRHPQYSGVSGPHRDAAVLKLRRPVRGVPIVKLAPVSSRNRLERPGSPATVAGWGWVSNDPTYPFRMQALRVPIVSDAYADFVYNDFFAGQIGTYVPRNMIGAGFSGGKNSCKGDSGGPLVKVVKQNGRNVHIQIGIVSFGPVPCAQQDVPAVYAEVNSTRIAPFIKSAARK